jgi:DNA-binding transcriptional MerR regulator
MGNEFRAQAYDGRDGAGGSEPSGSDAEDSITIGELARESGVTLRALRFYQSKGLLAPQRSGCARVFTHADRDRLALILQGKRLGFTLIEIREMLAARVGGCATALPISRGKCVEQIDMLERQRRDIDTALAELRRIYSEMFTATDVPRRVARHGA